MIDPDRMPCMELRAGRGCRRQARRLAAARLVRVYVLSRADEVLYNAWVNEAGRLIAYIFERGECGDKWLRECPTSGRKVSKR